MYPENIQPNGAYIGVKMKGNFKDEIPRQTSLYPLLGFSARGKMMMATVTPIISQLHKIGFTKGKFKFFILERIVFGEVPKLLR
jgi:hypothetical protein